MMDTGFTCGDSADHLMGYLDGVLDEALRHAIDAHLAGCPRCVAFVRSYASVSTILREATRATLPPAGRDALRRALATRRR
jgi:anti-sigma factor RsiW